MISLCIKCDKSSLVGLSSDCATYGLYSNLLTFEFWRPKFILVFKRNVTHIQIQVLRLLKSIFGSLFRWWKIPCLWGAWLFWKIWLNQGFHPHYSATYKTPLDPAHPITQHFIIIFFILIVSQLNEATSY